jgi:hypothetical protein
MLVREFKDSQGETCYTVQGDNLPDVQRWLRDTPATWNITHSRTNMARHSWDLGVGYDGALRLAETGWSEGAKDLSDKLSAHMPERDHVDSWRYDVAGELPDIGRFLAGDPAHMKRHGHPKGNKPIVSLLVNICCSGSVTAEQFANYGAAMANVIDQIENSGRRVELNVAMVTQLSKRVTVGWTVKQAEDPLDIAAIAFSLAHPAALRRIGFAMIERTPTRPTMGYGHVTNVHEEDWSDPLPGTYCIQGVGLGGSQTISAAIEQVTRQVNQAAGETLVTKEG